MTKNIVYSFSIVAVITLLFSIFYLHWFHLQHDVGRELYQAFSIATENKTLYTDLTHYFGPLAPYTNALFLKLFGATLFNFSLIGLLLSITCSLLIYFISNTILSSEKSLIASLVFTSFGVINEGGGSLFMPYSYAHLYGITLTLLSTLLFLKLKNNYSFYLHTLFLVCLSFLPFIKQEYILVFIMFNMIWIIFFIFYDSLNFLNIAIFHFFFQISALVLLHEFLFIDYSVYELWESSKSMFQEHNRGILHNFLMLYSPSTLKIAFITSSPLFILSGINQILKRKYIQGSIIIGVGFILVALFHQTLYDELLKRGFILNWITISLGIFYGFQVYTKKKPFDTIFILILISISLYNRQQSASWMWQGLNWIILFYLLSTLVDTVRYKLSTLFFVILLTIGIFTIPFKLNQGLDPVQVYNRWGESLPVKAQWSDPIQKAVTYFSHLPDSITLYTGQESAWFNVVVRKYNNVRNQQWWGYMKEDIIEDIDNEKPDYLLLTFYDTNNEFKFFGNGDSIFNKIASSYVEDTRFENDHIRIIIYKVNE